VRIATVTPTFDRPTLLREALISIGSQTRQADEVHIVVDAGPSISNIVSEFEQRLPLQIHYLSENRGQAAARNHALARSDADAIAFLDDDDLFLNTHLERLERSLTENPEAALVYDDCRVENFRADGERRGFREIAREYDPVLMRTHDYIPPCSWLVRSESVQRAGGFDSSFRCYEDWDLILRLEAWGAIKRTPGLGSVVRIFSQVSVDDQPPNVRDHDNQSRRHDAARYDALARFEAKHGLDGIEPMTFWEVAETVEKTPLASPRR
jgi:glycosyltransferase involved in cell wall biosynthesis